MQKYSKVSDSVKRAKAVQFVDEVFDFDSSIEMVEDVQQVDLLSNNDMSEHFCSTFTRERYHEMLQKSQYNLNIVNNGINKILTPEEMTLRTQDNKQKQKEWIEGVRKSLVLIYSTEAYHPNYPPRSYNKKRRTIVRLYFC